MTLTKLAWPTAAPHTTEDHISQENLGVYINFKTQSSQRGRGDRKVSNGTESLGHWHLIQSQQTWNRQGCCHMVSNQFWGFDVMHVALVVMIWKETKVSSYFWGYWWCLHVEGEPDLWTLEQMMIRGYLPLTLFAPCDMGQGLLKSFRAFSLQLVRLALPGILPSQLIQLHFFPSTLQA